MCHFVIYIPCHCPPLPLFLNLYATDSRKSLLKNINICLLNSRSLVNKSADLQSFVYSSSYNVKCVTETWLFDSIFDHEILPLNFTIYCKDRAHRCGGVLVAINDSLPSVLVSSPPNLESIVVQIGSSHPFTLCTIYVPPNSREMYDMLISFLTDTLSSENPRIIVGDFNLRDICWSSLMGKSPISSSFCDFVFRCNLTQHIQDPTLIF